MLKGKLGKKNSQSKVEGFWDLVKTCPQKDACKYEFIEISGYTGCHQVINK